MTADDRETIVCRFTDRLSIACNQRMLCSVGVQCYQNLTQQQNYIIV
jgi:hypothetical protein